MANLLPESYKKTIHLEYLLRFVVVALVMSFALLVIGIILLVPSYVISSIQSNATKQQISLIQSQKTQENRMVDETVLKRTEAELKVFSTEKSFSEVEKTIQTVLGHMPAGIALSTINYEKKGKGEATQDSVILSGLASTRSDLLAFRSALEKETSFSSVVLPYSNLAKDKDVAFSITIMLIDGPDVLY